MGIKAINKFLEKNCPECFLNIPLFNFHSHRLAIDASNWVFTNMAVAHKQVVMESINPVDEPLDREKTLNLTYVALIRFLVRLMNHGITPVWVSDGQPLPEKRQTREKRQQERDNNKAVAESLLNGLKTTPILLRSRESIEQYKRKLVYQDVVGSGDIEMCRNLVSGLGIPSIIAPNDAEILCSAMAIEGLVIGVWSTDTDNYALGTPLMVTGFATHVSGQLGVDVVMTPIIRQRLGLSQETLRDLCIASGCDYNSNIPNIGPAKSYKFLSQYKSIEEFIKTRPDLPAHMYNHIRCRQIFTPTPSGYTHNSTLLHLDRDRFMTMSRDLVTQYGLSLEYESLIAATKCVASPKLVTFTDGTESSSTGDNESRSPAHSPPDPSLSRVESGSQPAPRAGIRLKIRTSSTQPPPSSLPIDNMLQQLTLQEHTTSSPRIGVLL